MNALSLSVPIFDAPRRRFGLWALVLLLPVAGCADFPNSGPSMGSLASGAQDDGMVINVVMLSPSTIGQYSRPAPADEPAPHRLPMAAHPYPIHRGDLLRVTIFEATDGGLFKSMQNGGNVFDQLRVSPDGTVLIPYAGKKMAAGKTREQLQREIIASLSGIATEPAVQVDVMSSDAAVSVSGDVKTPGSFPLIDGPQTVLDAINKAGGSGQPALQTDVVLRRDDTVRRMSLRSLMLRHGDESLKPGDDIVVEAYPRTFVSMGAVKQPGIFPLQKVNASLLDVLGQVGGLVDAQADPTGVFVFRGAAVAGAPAAARPTPTAPEVFVLNMRQPTAVFLARSFTVEPDDVVYVSNAPLYQFGKVISLLSGAGSLVNNGKALSGF